MAIPTTYQKVQQPQPAQQQYPTVPAPSTPGALQSAQTALSTAARSPASSAIMTARAATAPPATGGTTPPSTGAQTQTVVSSGTPRGGVTPPATSTATGTATAPSYADVSANLRQRFGDNLYAQYDPYIQQWFQGGGQPIGSGQAWNPIFGNVAQHLSALTGQPVPYLDSTGRVVAGSTGTRVTGGAGGYPVSSPSLAPQFAQGDFSGLSMGNIKFRGTPARGQPTDTLPAFWNVPASTLYWLQQSGLAGPNGEATGDWRSRISGAPGYQVQTDDGRVPFSGDPNNPVGQQTVGSPEWWQWVQAQINQMHKTGTGLPDAGMATSTGMPRRSTTAGVRDAAVAPPQQQPPVTSTSGAGRTPTSGRDISDIANATILPAAGPGDGAGGGGGPTTGGYGGLPDFQPYGPGNDLRGTQINPSTSPRMADILEQLDRSRAGLEGPDRGRLAADALALFEEESDPRFQDRLRAVEQLAARSGASGSGVINRRGANVVTERERELGQARRFLANEAAGLSLQDRQNILRSVSGLADQEYGFGAGNRAELRGERGWQNQMQQQALMDYIRGMTLEDALTGSAFGREQSRLGLLLGTGFGDTGSGAALGAAGVYANQGNDAYAYLASLGDYFGRNEGR